MLASRDADAVPVPQTVMRDLDVEGEVRGDLPACGGFRRVVHEEIMPSW